MDEFLNQINSAFHTRLFYMSLFGALTVPDICGALESSDGQATGAKYIFWFDRFVSSSFNQGISSGKPKFDGKEAWSFRCALLHQGTTSHFKSKFSRVMFLEPGSPLRVHHGFIDDAYCMDLQNFCDCMISGAKDWLATVQGTQPFDNNYAKFVRSYPNGLAPYISGITVIS